MKKLQKPKKIVFLSLIAGFIYLLMVFSTLMSEWDDTIWLLMGVVVLLIAEIISRGVILKEEQELTI